MKNILVLIHDDAGQEARVRAAFDLARATGGHVICADVVMTASVANEYVGAYAALLVEDDVQAERENRLRLEARLSDENIPFDWVELNGDPATCLAGIDRICDLVVVNRDLGNGDVPGMLGLAADLIVRGRVPILAVPPDLPHLELGGNALVAWDGSRDSEAALRAAIPLLRLARRVTLLHAEDGSMKIPIEDAVAYLSRYGIDAVVRRERVLMDRPGAVILAEIAASSADYLVMGGFSRSPIIEAAFGGASRRALIECPVPILMAHRK